MKSLELTTMDHTASNTVCAVAFFVWRWTDLEFEAQVIDLLMGNRMRVAIRAVKPCEYSEA